MAETRAPQNAGRSRSGYYVCCTLREPKGLTGGDPPCRMAVPWGSRRNGGHVIYSSVSRVFPPGVCVCGGSVPLAHDFHCGLWSTVG